MYAWPRGDEVGTNFAIYYLHLYIVPLGNVFLKPILQDMIMQGDHIIIMQLQL